MDGFRDEISIRNFIEAFAEGKWNGNLIRVMDIKEFLINHCEIDSDQLVLVKWKKCVSEFFGCLKF